MLDVYQSAFINIFEPERLMMLAIGVVVGLIVGILPGLGGIVGMSLLLPFIFGMDPLSAMPLLIGMAAVIHTADTFTSVLIGVPGSAGSQATVMDGYPLAQKGEAARALGAAFLASMIGGLFGAAVLAAILPVARPIVLFFGSPELFMLTLLGLSMVGVLSGTRPVRGLAAASLGLLVGAVGGAPAVPHYRYTYDLVYLLDGIPLAALALGLFAVPEMLDLLISRSSISKSIAVGKGWIRGFSDVIRHFGLVLRCSVIGVLIGTIPGLGGSVIDWISYGQTVQTARDKSQFGKGDIRGLIAPESSNNAKEGGVLVPTLLFGLPGSGTTAILLGGFILLGIDPGPRLISERPEIVVTIVWTLAIANVIGAVACLSLTPLVVRLTTIRPEVLVPFLLAAMLIGAYQTTRHWGDLVVFIIFGLLGWAMKHLDWPRVPLLIGFVLAANAERYLWISVNRFGWEWMVRPSVVAIGVLMLILVYSGSRMKASQKREVAT